MGVATNDYSHNTPDQNLEHAPTNISDPATTVVSTSSCATSEAGWMQQQQQQQSLSSCPSSSTAVTASEKDGRIAVCTAGWSQLQWLQLAIVDTQVLATTVKYVE